MTITEFLEARIAEDEARASSGWTGLGHARWETDNYGRDHLTASAVLAECAAKRAIVEGTIPERDPQSGNPDYDPLWVIRELAAVYKDHPAYDPAWTPNGS